MVNLIGFKVATDGQFGSSVIIMDGVNLKIWLILCLAATVAHILPAWGNKSDDVITQLELQMQSMNQRLEKLEQKVKICTADKNEFSFSCKYSCTLVDDCNSN